MDEKQFARKDRSEKLLNRKFISETVVKCSLQSILVKDDFTDMFVEAVEKRMVACSKRTWNASICLNLLIRERFQGISDPTLVQLPDFCDQTFLRQLLLGTSGAVKPFPEITDLFDRHPTLLSHEKRHIGDRNIYSAAAIKLSTNIKNHLVVNFPRFLKKYLYKVSGLTHDEAVASLYLINGWKQQRKKDIVLDMVKVDYCSRKLRYILGIGDETKVTDRWLKSNLPSILRLFVYINRALELNSLPLFNILPIMKIKAHFITMDTSVFTGILKDIGVAYEVPPETEMDFWYSVFNIQKITGKGKTFTRTMDTDGVAVNVHFNKPKVASDIKSVMNLKGKRVIGVDPGRTNIFEMVEKLKDGTYKEYSLTRNQYYTEAGMIEARKHSEHWNRYIRKEIAALSEASPKSMKLSKFMIYIKTSQQAQAALWNEYLNKHWRQQRLRLYGGKKRVFSKFLNRLGPLDNTVLAYGSAKFASGGKGEMSVPTTRAFKECSYRLPIVLVDEFRTSKIYWKNGTILELVNTFVSKKPLRGLLWCCSTSTEKGKFINRDVNAAINILNCATLPTRPIALQRSPNLRKIVQHVGKTIRF